MSDDEDFEQRVTSWIPGLTVCAGCGRPLGMYSFVLPDDYEELPEPVWRYEQGACPVCVEFPRVSREGRRPVSDEVRVEWELPPYQGDDGGWYRKYQNVWLPRDIAEIALKKPPTVRIVPSPIEVVPSKFNPAYAEWAEHRRGRGPALNEETHGKDGDE